MLHVQDRIAFVEALELPPTPPGLLTGVPPVIEADTKAGYVDGGSLLSFVAGVKLLHKQDTLNSTLLAQLAANAKHDRERQTREWYDWYRTVLENVGWVVQAFEFTQYQASGMEFTADKVVLQILAAIATGNDLAVVTATMDALNKLGAEDPAVKLFETQSHSARRGSFQISAASESDGVVVLKIGAFHFSTSEDVTRVLWFRFKSAQTQMWKGAQVMNLDDQVYEQVRQAVLDKLGDKAVTFVRDLKI